MASFSSSEDADSLMSAIAALERRLAAVEQQQTGDIDGVPGCIVAETDPIQRIKKDLRLRHIYVSRFVTVPSHYYSLPLEQRAAIVGCHYTQLCKSIILENTSWSASDEAEDASDISNSRYFCVLLQYCSRLEEDKVQGALLKWRLEHAKKAAGRGAKGAPSAATIAALSKKKFHFRLAPSEVNDSLTGFTHNAVCPFGINSRDGRSIPILVSKACLDATSALVSGMVMGTGTSSASPGTFLYMGGGHVDVKLGLNVADFIRASGALVAEISVPRSDGDSDSADV